MKKIYWIIILFLLAVVLSIIFKPKIEEEVIPEPPEVFVNSPTAKEALMEIRANKTKEVVEAVEVVKVNITDPPTENIDALKDERRGEPENWTYYYHPNNTACYASCNFDVCTILEGWCDANETEYLEEIIN